MSGHVISKHGLNIMMSVPDVLAKIRQSRIGVINIGTIYSQHSGVGSNVVLATLLQNVVY